MLHATVSQNGKLDLGYGEDGPFHVYCYVVSELKRNDVSEEWTSTGWPGVGCQFDKCVCFQITLHVKPDKVLICESFKRQKIGISTQFQIYKLRARDTSRILFEFNQHVVKKPPTDNSHLLLSMGKELTQLKNKNQISIKNKTNQSTDVSEARKLLFHFSVHLLSNQVRLGFFLIVPFQNVEPTEVVHTETKVALTEPRVLPTYYKVLSTQYNQQYLLKLNLQ